MSGLPATLPSTANIRVNVSIPHTASGDLVILLGSPDGSIYLAELDGRLVPDVFNPATFVDSSPYPVDYLWFFTTPHILEFSPSYPLADFRGHNTTGIWSLVVIDYIWENSGHLDQWSIEFDRKMTTPPRFLLALSFFHTHPSLVLFLLIAVNNNCQGVTCQHGGLCVNQFQGWYCDCSTSGYTGNHCELCNLSIVFAFR